jgi:cytochrome oxidase Cu insertion factor (SCO1/SenC/PrrC family)
MVSRRYLPLIGAMMAALAAIAVASFLFWQQILGNGQVDTAATGEVITAPGLSMGGPFTLTAHTGEEVSSSAFEGDFMLIYFGYTFCPDICPLELATMAATLDILAETDPEVAEAVKPVFITVDPARDTVDVIGEYVAAFHPDFVGFTGGETEVASLAREFRVYVAKHPPDEYGDYLVDHTGYVYLMGPNGEFVTLFQGGNPPEILAEGLRRRVKG